jgi:peptidoglycan/xylan/chitin deacetylase (PgdA/CDA1 family)
MQQEIHIASHAAFPPASSVLCDGHESRIRSFRDDLFERTAGLETENIDMRDPRTLNILALIAGLLLAGPMTGPASAAEMEACASNPDLLGVSRVVEIDTDVAPKFGSQYANSSFLEDGEVILTFDDGPLRPYTKRVLDALDEQCTKATFFVVGRMAVADPELLKETRRRGHTIGLHTYGHSKLSVISADRAKDDIELGLSAIAKALEGSPAPFFRFPYLRDTKATISHLGERHIGIFGIDIDSRDFSTRNPAEVQKTILRQLAVQRKGIILMHDIQTSTAGAIRSLLAELRSRGFKIVHVVPKADATTLADYDQKAGELLAGKMVAAAKSPLATRSVVWPAGKTKGGKSAVATAPGDDDALPWLNGQTAAGAEAAPSPSPAPAPVRAPRRPEPPGLSTNPWQIGPSTW